MRLQIDPVVKDIPPELVGLYPHGDDHKQLTIHLIQQFNTTLRHGYERIIDQGICHQKKYIIRFDIWAWVVMDSVIEYILQHPEPENDSGEAAVAYMTALEAEVKRAMAKSTQA